MTKEQAEKIAERILSYVYSANASEPVSKVVASIIEEALTASSVKVPSKTEFLTWFSNEVAEGCVGEELAEASYDWIVGAIKRMQEKEEENE
jgi:hypothetical protein